MALNQEGLFIQRMVVDGEDIDLSFLQTCVLVETLDLSGPKLIVTFHDPDSILRDDLGVRPLSELEVTFADYWNDNSDAELKDTFTVLTMPVKNESVTLNCLQKDVHALKTPALKAQMFVNKPVTTIVRALSPGVPCSAGGFPVGADYQLLPGERPSVVLRQMALELGGKFYYQRGKFYMGRVVAMLSQDAAMTYAYEDRQAEYQIIHYSRPNAGYMVKDVLLRDYRGWNMTNGFISALKHDDRPVEFVSNDTMSALKNLTVTSFPEVDFITHGHGMLRPGISLDLEWNLLRNDSPIDESLPGKIVIGTAAHFYSAQKYFVRIKGILPV
jgi:hypothetical protein